MTDDLFFDTDCLSAFLWINETNILHELYGGRIVLPEPVYQELSNPCIPHIKQRADIMINNKDIYVKTIDTDTAEYKLYAELVHGEMGQKSIVRVVSPVPSVPNTMASFASAASPSSSMETESSHRAIAAVLKPSSFSQSSPGLGQSAGCSPM